MMRNERARRSAAVVLWGLLGCGGGSSGDGGAGPPDLPRFVLTGTITDSLTGLPPDSVALTLDGQAVAVSPGGAFVKTLDSGVVALNLTIPGYVPLSQAIALSTDQALTLHPVRSRPAVLLQLIQGQSVAAALYDAQGWSTIDFTSGGTLACASGPGFTDCGSGATWVKQQYNSQIVSVAFNEGLGFPTSVRWYLVDLEGNGSTFFCGGGSCVEE